MNNEIDLDFLKDCLQTAGKLAFARRGQRLFSIKEDLSPVTEVDKQVEMLLIERILTRYPAHSVLSEESGERTGERTFTWVIDPIDGTRAFASGLPVWGISIGILREAEPFAGGLYLPVTGEMYWGTREQAFYNDRPMPRIETVELESSLAFLGVPSNFHLHYDITYPRIRSIGSTAAQLAYVATGAAVGELTRTIGLWDVAGVLPLLVATGIRTEYLSGAPFNLLDVIDGRPIDKPLLAAHPSVMQFLREKIQAKGR